MGRRQNKNYRPAGKAPATAPPGRAGRWLPLLAALITAVAWLPALRNGFVNWDDPEMVSENPHLRELSLQSVGWMFSTFRLGHYQPLSWLSLAFDRALWGPAPSGYHLTSLLLHALNAALLYCLLRRLLDIGSGVADTGARRSRDGAALIATLFWSLHPLRVESVAWVTERRDLLLGAFSLLCLLSYLRARTAAAGRTLLWPWLFFLCALLSHGLALTLPVALLALDFFPLRRFGAEAPPAAASLPQPQRGRPLLEKIPFLLLSTAFAAIAVVAARQVRAMRTLDEHGVVLRLGQAARGLWFYVAKTLLPASLSPLYELKPAAAGWSIAAIAATLATAVAAWHWRRRLPALLTALLAGAALLAPVLGFLQSGLQWAADRYTYTAGMAGAALLAAALPVLFARLSGLARGTVILVLGAGLFLLAGFTRAQLERWHDSVTLWTYASGLDPESGIAHFKLGQALRESGQPAAAQAEFEEAARLRPTDPVVRGEWGIVLAETGRHDEAIREISAALADNPGFSRGYYNRAVSYEQRGGPGDAEAAIRDYGKAIELEPRDSKAYNNRAVLRQRAGDVTGALADFEQAARLLPGDWQTRANLGMALAQAGRRVEALAALDEAARSAPAAVQARLAEARAAVAAGAVIGNR